MARQKLKNNVRQQMKRRDASEKMKIKSKRKVREYITGTSSRSGDPFSKKTKSGQKRRDHLASHLRKMLKIGGNSKHAARVHKSNVGDFGKRKVT
tara:strand:+ start:2629 stop:2913 length:285 start_codon:yes stop_codon:yes gene_type:complete